MGYRRIVRVEVRWLDEMASQMVMKPSATEQAIVDVLDVLLDCGMCERHPETMREHVELLRSFYSHETTPPAPPEA